MAELEKLNESLRRALAASGAQQGVDAAVDSVKVVYPAKIVLCHTTHFLGADKNGLLGKAPKLSAYNTAGVF